MATDTIQRAVDAARQKHSAAVWLVMRPAERTAAIYEEIRRLDAEAIANALVQDQPQPQIRRSLP